MQFRKFIGAISSVAFLMQVLAAPQATAAVGAPGARRPAPSGSKQINYSEPIGDKWAVVIGVSQFADPRVPTLKYASKDAKDFYDYLVDANGGKFQPDHVKLLLNSDASRINIMDMLGDSFLPHAAAPNDLVVIYLSTHGSPAGADLKGVNYVVAYDTRPNKLFASGLEMRQLLRTVKERVHTNRVMLVLDTCYSGAGAIGGGKGMMRTNVDSNSLAQGIGSLVISSSSPDQRSWESDSLKNSYFTRYFIDTLRETGTNAPVESVFNSMKAKVQGSVLREKGEMQTPVMAGAFSGPRLVLSVPPTQIHPAPITIPLTGEAQAAGSTSAKGEDFASYGQQMRTAQQLIDQGKFFDAMHELDEAIKSNPSSVEAQLTLSDVLDAQAKYMQSLEAAKAAVRNDEASAQAHEKLSRAYVRLLNFDEALRQAQQAATLDPQSSMAMYWMGVVNEKSGGRVDQAEQFYRKAIELNGANVPACVGLANLLRGQNRNPDEAEKLINNAIAADSEDPDAQLAYARFLYQVKGQGAEAQKALRTAIANAPNDPILHAELGVALSQTPETVNDAEAEFRKAIELNNTVGYPHSVFARFLAQSRQRYDQAEDEYRLAIKSDPSLDAARVEYGNLLVNRKKYDDADDQYNKALTFNPKNSLALLGLGRIKYELFKDYPGAIVLLDKAIVIDPKLSAAYDLEGEVYYKGMARYADAKNSYAKAIAADPKNAAANFHLATMMLDRVKENNPQAILDALTKAVTNGPSESAYQTRLGYVLQTYFKQYKEAQDAYRKAITLNVADAEAHYQLGLLLITKFGLRKEGERELRTAYEQDPKDADIKLAYERYVR
jgi:tetratricopeptide (TPR) repeat protein